MSVSDHSDTFSYASQNKLFFFFFARAAWGVGGGSEKRKLLLVKSRRNTSWKKGIRGTGKGKWERERMKE